MTTILRTWPWAAGLASLLVLAPLGLARGQEGPVKSRTAILYDPLLSAVHPQNGLFAGKQNGPTGQSVPETQPLKLTEVKVVNHLTGDTLTADELTMNGFYTALIRDPSDPALGATLEPVSDSLRAQLGIPVGQGLVITSLAGDGPAAESGLKENDILLYLADKPLASAGDLPRQLKAVGEAPVGLKVVRAGKPLNVQVRPVYHVTIGPVRVEKTDYHVGIAVAPPDDVLRAHLVLADGVGLVATHVVPSSPAEKAGVKIHDILLELNGKPLDKPETLVTQVRASGGKPTTLKLLREGKPLTVTITPEIRKTEAEPHHQTVRLWSLSDRPHPSGELSITARHPAFRTGGGVRGAPSGDPVDKRLDALDRELKALRQAVDELRDAIKAGRSKGGD